MIYMIGRVLRIVYGCWVKCGMMVLVMWVGDFRFLALLGMTR